jgi:hypothetical protein
VILRVPLLYGEVETLEENAVTILLKNLKNTETQVKMDEYDKYFEIPLTFSFIIKCSNSLSDLRWGCR